MRVLLFLTTALALLASACASDGRELAEPQDWQTTTTRPAPPTSAPPQLISENGLTLRSPDFEPGDSAPSGALCSGDNRFPNLEWEGVPEGTAELAIALSDQTDPEEPLLLWLMAGIDPSMTSAASGTFPNEGAFETLNDYGQPGYGNPCLENVAQGQRDLQFRLYVLPRASGMSSGDPGNESWDTVAALATDSATVLMRVEASI